MHALIDEVLPYKEGYARVVVAGTRGKEAGFPDSVIRGNYTYFYRELTADEQELAALERGKSTRN